MNVALAKHSSVQSCVQLRGAMGRRSVSNYYKVHCFLCWGISLCDFDSPNRTDYLSEALTFQRFSDPDRRHKTVWGIRVYNLPFSGVPGGSEALVDGNYARVVPIEIIPYGKPVLPSPSRTCNLPHRHECPVCLRFLQHECAFHSTWFDSGL